MVAMFIGCGLRRGELLASRRILLGTRTFLSVRSFSIGEQADYAVRPLAARLRELVGAYESLDEASARALGAAFLKPIGAS